MASLGGFADAIFANGLYVAGGYGAIHTSLDSTNWSRHLPYRVPTGYLAFGRNKFVISTADEIVTSEDGSAWLRQKLSVPTNLVGMNSLRGAFFGDIRFVNDAFWGLTLNALVSSPDAINWKSVYAWTDAPQTGMELSLPTSGNGKYVAVGTWYELSGRTRFGFSLTSGDGAAWTRHGIATRDGLGPVAFGDGKFVAAARRGAGSQFFWSSTNGVTWEAGPPVASEAVSAIAFGNHTFVAVTAVRKFWVSKDGVNWLALNVQSPRDIRNIAFADNSFIAVGDGTILTSTNGINWISRSIPSYDSFHHVAFGQGTFVIVGSAEIFQSGIVYSQPRITGFEPLPDSTWSITGVIPDGKPYRLESSANLIDWTRAARLVRTNAFPKFIDDAPRGMARFYRLVTE